MDQSDAHAPKPATAARQGQGVSGANPPNPPTARPPARIKPERIPAARTLRGASARAAGEIRVPNIHIDRNPMPRRCRHFGDFLHRMPGTLGHPPQITRSRVHRGQRRGTRYARGHHARIRPIIDETIGRVDRPERPIASQLNPNRRPVIRLRDVHHSHIVRHAAPGHRRPASSHDPRSPHAHSPPASPPRHGPAASAHWPGN